MFPPGEFDNVLHSSTSQKAAQAFVQYFTREYIQPLQMQARARARSRETFNDDGYDGNNSNSADAVDVFENPFRSDGYNSTIQQLATQSQNYTNTPDAHAPPPLLLIYIHSPLHSKVPSFLRKTFCDSRILSLIHEHRNNGTLTCWGGSVHTADGASAMESLSVTSFPFLSLVRILPSSSRPNSNNNNGDSMSPQERKLELLFRMQGPALQSVSPATLHTHLSSSLRHYEGILSEQTLRRLQRLEEVRLREEQDREYRETLEADQERQRLKKEEEDRVREEEKRLKEEQEKLEREKREKLEKARSLLEKSSNGESNVTCSSSDESQPVKMTRVRLMLPSGKRLERKFKGDDTIDTIRAFLVLHFEETGIVMENFQLNSNYPRKALVDGDKTLESEGLCPQAVIMVQDLDA